MGNIRELKQRRRQRERQKSNRAKLANNNFARASRFFVHFLAVVTVARLQREIHVLSRTGTQDKNFHFPFLNFDTVF